MKRLGKLNCVTVWLVLLGFLCGMMMPAVSVARVHREIDTEGDPGDGFGIAGGGFTGSVEEPGTAVLETPIGDPVVVVFVVTDVDGRLVVLVEVMPREFVE